MEGKNPELSHSGSRHRTGVCRNEHSLGHRFRPVAFLLSAGGNLQTAAPFSRHEEIFRRQLLFFSSEVFDAFVPLLTTLLFRRLSVFSRQEALWRLLLPGRSL